MKKFLLLLISLLAVCTLVFLSSCSKRVEIQEKRAGEERPPAPVGAPRAAPEPVQPGPAITPGPQPEQIPAVPEQPAPPEIKVEKGPAGAELPVKEGRTSPGLMPVYFDFDHYTIRPDMVSRMENNATWLKSKPKARIRIEANTDERGSNEYNLALGQRRANSAKEYLSNLGIAPDRIEILSFGEERPLAGGHDEESWKVNRRDDFLAIK